MKIVYAAAFLAVAASASAAPVQWAGNGHWYAYVSAPATFAAARTAAEASAHEGLTGYLATVTSQEENDFIVASVSAALGWIGASDAEQEGVWRWVTGPEAGQALVFENWSGGEPNNLGNEDAAHMNWASGGRWNDHKIANSYGYFVEYGGASAPVPLPAALPLLAAAFGLGGLVAARRRS